MVVGASSGVMGLAGALWLGRTCGVLRVQERLDLVSSRGLGGMLAAVLVVGFAVPFVAQAGHVGGLVTGLVLGAALLGRGRRWTWGGTLGCLAWLALLVLGATRPSERSNYDEFLGLALLERGQLEAGVVHMERAYASRPEDPALANGFAYALAEAGVDLQRAEELVQAALSAEPGNPDYLDTLGWIYCQRGDTALGREWLLKAIAASDAEDEEIQGHLVVCGADASAVVPRETSPDGTRQ